MERRLIIDGNEVYEIDEACMIKKKVDISMDISTGRNKKRRDVLPRRQS